MNSKKAHDKLKEINNQRNAIGTGGFKDSRRTRCEQHDKFNVAMNEMNKLNDDFKIKEIENGK